MESIFTEFCMAKQVSDILVNGMSAVFNCFRTASYLPGRILKKKSGCIKCDTENSDTSILFDKAFIHGNIELTLKEGKTDLMKSNFDVTCLAQLFNQFSSYNFSHPSTVSLTKNKAILNLSSTRNSLPAFPILQYA